MTLTVVYVLPLDQVGRKQKMGSNLCIYFTSSGDYEHPTCSGWAEAYFCINVAAFLSKITMTAGSVLLLARVSSSATLQ